MGKKDPKYLAWVDLETTGLDPNVHKIIEFALVVTDLELNEMDQWYSAIVRPLDVTVALNGMDDFVRNMHKDNGLLREIDSGKGVPYRTVEKEVCTILGKIGEPGDFLIAGSGVAQFDLPWLRSHMPSIAAFFQYAPYDIGMIRRFVKYTLGRPDLVPVENLDHRAMADLNDFITQARAFKSIFDHVVRAGEDEET